MLKVVLLVDTSSIRTRIKTPKAYPYFAHTNSYKKARHRNLLPDNQAETERLYNAFNTL
jgi:hypothetical protein